MQTNAARAGLFLPENSLQFDQLSQIISLLLTKAKTRDLGLDVLNRLFNQIPIKFFEQKANFWISHVLKSYTEDTNAGVVFTLLAKFCEQSLRSTDISRSFANNYLTKIFDLIQNSQSNGNLEALKCIYCCLGSYPTACRPSRNLIESFLIRFIDSTDDCISCWTGKCFHSLQTIRAGDAKNLSQKGVWEDYQNKLLGSIHEVLTMTFSKYLNLLNQNSFQDRLTIPNLNISVEPVSRAMQLYIRFQNLVTYLIYTIREPFPAKKAIRAKKILELISRCLSIPIKVSEENETIDNMAMQIVFPKIHYQLLKLLEALLMTLRSHLKMYYHSIMDIITEVLRKQSIKSTESGIYSNLLVRSKAYDLLSLWCSIAGSGSRVNQIAEFIIEEILNDACPAQNSLTLKVQQDRNIKSARKKQRKNNFQTLQTASYKSVTASEMENSVCIAALRCLQQILISSSNFLNAPTVKATQVKIVEMCSNIYSKNISSQNIYAHTECRLELLKVLYTLVIVPHHFCPPPIDIILDILGKSQHLDESLLVRKNCAQMSLDLEKIVHPQKGTLIFKQDLREIRNVFSKYGRENLISSGIFEAQENELSNSADNELPGRDLNISKEQTENENSCNDKDTQISCNQYDNVEDEDEILSVGQNKTTGENQITSEEKDTNMEEESNKIINDDDNSAISDDKYVFCGKHLSRTLEDDENFKEIPLLKKQKLSSDVQEKDIELAQKDTGSVSEDSLFADLKAAFVNELNK